MSDCFVLYLLLTCMKKKTSGADKFTNNREGHLVKQITSQSITEHQMLLYLQGSVRMMFSWDIFFRGFITIPKNFGLIKKPVLMNVLQSLRRLE